MVAATRNTMNIKNSQNPETMYDNTTTDNTNDFKFKVKPTNRKKRRARLLAARSRWSDPDYHRSITQPHHLMSQIRCLSEYFNDSNLQNIHLEGRTAFLEMYKLKDQGLITEAAWSNIRRWAEVREAEYRFLIDDYEEEMKDP